MKNTPAKILCSNGNISNENVVNNSNVNDGNSQFFIWYKYVDVVAFAIMNIGCISVPQYEDSEGLYPWNIRHINGDRKANIITDILI